VIHNLTPSHWQRLSAAPAGPAFRLSVAAREQRDGAARVDDVVIRGIDLDILSGLEKVLTARKADVPARRAARVAIEWRPALPRLRVSAYSLPMAAPDP